MDVGRVAPVKYPLIQTRGRASGNCSNLGNLRNNGPTGPHWDDSVITIQTNPRCLIGITDALGEKCAESLCGLVSKFARDLTVEIRTRWKPSVILRRRFHAIHAHESATGLDDDKTGAGGLFDPTVSRSRAGRCLYRGRRRSA